VIATLAPLSCAARLICAAPRPDEGFGFWQSLILGVVEGVTEFLPISSTGHLIVVNALYERSDPSFEVAIQAGAITAILVRYWRQLLRATVDLFARSRSGSVNLLWLIAIAAAPAAIVGMAFEERIEDLLFRPITVAITMLLGGVLLLWLERHLGRRQRDGRPVVGTIETMTVRQALAIGAWQTLALIPGTSRSGATIAGGLLNGCTRVAAAEFSFLVGLPLLYGACLVKVGKDWERMTGPMLPDLLLASAAAFVSALLVVGPFVRFLQRSTFAPFAWYRILAGVALLCLCASGVL
jgi:undecaprenyl-diphosphatase